MVTTQQPRDKGYVRAPRDDRVIGREVLDPEKALPT